MHKEGLKKLNVDFANTKTLTITPYRRKQINKLKSSKSAKNFEKKLIEKKKSSKIAAIPTIKQRKVNIESEMTSGCQ